MTTDSTTTGDDANLFLGAAWFDPIEAGIRGQIRGFIEALIEQELAAALGRTRYQRRPGATAGMEAPADPAGAGDAADPPPIVGHRHGRRTRRLVGSFGAVELAVPRARLHSEGGAAREWRSAVLPRYARRTRQVEGPCCTDRSGGVGERPHPRSSEPSRAVQGQRRPPSSHPQAAAPGHELGGI